MDEQPDLNRRDEASSDEPSNDAASNGETAGPVGQPEERLAALRAAVQQGLDDIKAGRAVDLDAAFDRIEQMLDEIEATERR